MKTDDGGYSKGLCKNAEILFLEFRMAPLSLWVTAVSLAVHYKVGF